MAPSRIAVLALAALSTTANAMIPAVAKRQHEFSPRTTDARILMGMEADHQNELGRRQATSTSEAPATWTMASGSTCGYLSGSPGNAITCDEGRRCEWNPDAGFLCYDATTAIGYVTCLASSRAVDPDVCNDVCQSNEFYLLCTASSAPFCRTYAYPSGARDFRCVASSQSRVSSVDWTYTGQDDPGFTTTVIGVAITSPDVNSDTITGPSTVTVTSATATNTDDGGGSGGSKPPVGAIVGGVVGGVAVISFVVLGAIYLIRRKRKAEPAAPANAAASQPIQPQPPFQNQPPVSMVDQKPPYVGSPVPSTVHSSTVHSPSVMSPTQSDWRGSSIMSPQSTGAPAGFAPTELSAQPPGYSNSVHEMSADPGHMR